MAITLGAGKTQVRAMIDATFGPIPSGLLPAEIATINVFRDALAQSIAEEGVYVRDSGKVKVGIDVNSSTFKTVTEGELS